MSLVASVLDRYKDTSVQAVIQEEAYQHLRQDLQRSRHINPYAVPPEAADELEKHGIITNPHNIRLHTHAACKAIENRCLEIIGEVLPQRPCTFMFLKPRKLDIMRRNKREIRDVFINQNIEPRDVARYPEETILADLPEITTDTVYISDTLHFLTPKWLARLFQNCPDIQTVYATLVLPPEALFRHASQKPQLYTINYDFGGFQYLPSSHGGGSYSHEFQQLEWLKIGKINWTARDRGGTSPGDGKKRWHCVTAQMVESLGANHIFVFSRGSLTTPRVRTFSKDNYVLLPKIFYPPGINCSKPISKTLAMKIFLYTKGVSAVTSRDLYSKLRQLLKSNELDSFDPDELVHLVNYFLLISHLDSAHNYEALMAMPIWTRFLMPMKTRLEAVWRTLTGETPYYQLLRMLEWETFTYSVEVEVIGLSAQNHTLRANWLGFEAFGDDMQDLYEWGYDPREDERASSCDSDTETDDVATPIPRRGEQSPRNSRSLAQALVDATNPTPIGGECTDSESTDGSQSFEPQTPPPEPSEAQERPGAPTPTATGAETRSKPCESLERQANKNSGSDKNKGKEPVAKASTSGGQECSKYLGITHSSPRLPAIPNLPWEQGLKLKNRSCLFFCRHKDWKYGHDAAVYNNEGWPEWVDELCKRLGNYNSCLAQRYTGGGIAAHQDNEAVYSHRDPILTINLEGTATFKVGTSRQCTGASWLLHPGQAIEMGPGFQETNYHMVTGCSPGRISLTLRRQARDLEVRDTVRLPPAATKAPEELALTRSNEEPTQSKLPASSNKAAVVGGALMEEREELPWKAWYPVLNACGFSGLEIQRDGLGNLIYPITQHNVLEKPDCPILPPDLKRQLVQMNRTPLLLEFSVKRAAAFASDIKNNRIGALTRSQTPAWKARLSAVAESASITRWCSIIHGAGGSGKSKVLQDWLNKQDPRKLNATVVVPTTELRADWEAKVPRAHRRTFKTHERALMDTSKPIVIFDDYGKFPAGFIETFLAVHANAEVVIMTGDSRQSVHHEDNSQAMSSHLEPLIDILQPHCRYYINATHRNRSDVANALGVYSEKKEKTSMSMNSTIKQGLPILAPAMIKKTCLEEAGHRAFTYAGCQGLTTRSVQILLDQNTPLCSERVMYTALSRAVEAIHFVNTGPNSNDYWTKLDCTPYLKAFIQTVREQKSIGEESPVEPKPAEVPEPKTHFPVENDSMLLEDLVEDLKEKHDREHFSTKHGHSNLIQTEKTIVQLFQHQQARDETLLWETIEKRIAVSTRAQNEKEFMLKKDIGDVLFMNYRRAMGLPQNPLEFSQELWDACRIEVQNKYLEKPIAALINGRLRQDPDFDRHKIKLFLKSQWVTKREAVGSNKPKVGQTIAAFMQETVMIFGTMARYMRRLREAFCPKKIFINCERRPEDLSDFVTEHWNFNGPSHENDFTAFDQSQDGAMLQFEVLKAKHHGIPAGIIRDYIMIKTTAEIFLGTLAIMRLTGEGPTFDANTECAIAYHFSKYEVPANAALVFAGDDMAQDCKPIRKKSFEMWTDKLKLVSKEMPRSQTPGDYPSFCGFRLTPAGAIKDPAKLYGDCCLAENLGKTADVRVSYTLDLKLAYKLGDKLFEHLTEKEGQMHQATVRKVHKWHTAHLLQ